MRIAGVVGVAVAVVVALGGCGVFAEAEPAALSEEQAWEDISRYAEQTAELVDGTLGPPTFTTAPCRPGSRSVQSEYLIPRWIRWQARGRDTLRTTWRQNRMPITVDSSPDGWLGAIGTVTPDGYSIDVTSYNSPKPRDWKLLVKSPCIEAAA